MRINILVAGHESHNRGEDIRRLNYVFKSEMGYIDYLPSVIDPYYKELHMADQTIELSIGDVIGLSGFSRMLADEFRTRDKDVYILVYSADSPESFHAITDKWFPCCKLGPSGTPIVLVCVNPEKRQELIQNNPAGIPIITTEQGKKLAEEIKAEYIECSLGSVTQVKVVFNKAAEVYIINKKKAEMVPEASGSHRVPAAASPATLLGQLSGVYRPTVDINISSSDRSPKQDEIIPSVQNNSKPEAEYNRDRNFDRP